MTGAGAVLSVVLLEWAVGLVAVAGWSQTWSVVRRGHFRIVAWTGLALATMAFFANRAALDDSGLDGGAQPVLAVAVVAACALYLLVQWSNTDVPGAVVGGATGLVGIAALVSTGGLLEGFSMLSGGIQLLAGAVLVGGVSNGMLLGHWYLNQPGLKPWALARITMLTLGAVGATGALGLMAAGRLAEAETEGAVLGLPGLGESFGLAFFVIWLVLLAFTAAVVWAARRCVQIRSIQSATGLYYVALLTAGVSEFLVRYLMVNA